MHRGLNPDEVSVKNLLRYNKHRDEFYDWQKQLWKKAASEIFGK